MPVGIEPKNSDIVGYLRRLNVPVRPLEIPCEGKTLPGLFATIPHAGQCF